jgi:hypothetical protein
MQASPLRTLSACSTSIARSSALDPLQRPGIGVPRPQSRREERVCASNEAVPRAPPSHLQKLKRRVSRYVQLIATSPLRAHRRCRSQCRGTRPSLQYLRVAAAKPRWTSGTPSHRPYHYTSGPPACCSTPLEDEVEQWHHAAAPLILMVTLDQKACAQSGDAPAASAPEGQVRFLNQLAAVCINRLERLWKLEAPLFVGTSTHGTWQRCLLPLEGSAARLVPVLSRFTVRHLTVTLQ